MPLRYNKTRNPTGLEVIDTSEQTRLRLRTSTDRFSPVPTDLPFEAFVDEAVSVETWYLEIPSQVGLTVRDREMNVLTEVRPGGTSSHPVGTYVLDFDSAVKCYVLLSGEVTIKVRHDRTRIEIDDSRRVVAGLRSVASKPEARIQTTDRPEDIAAALSVLSSSMKTSSAERSWPNLRGHPPRIELGGTLKIPDGLSPPNSNIRIVVPPKYSTLFAAAPAAYYLGATLQTGSTAHVRTETRTKNLGDERTVEKDLGRLLRKTFVLDAIVRGYGMYQKQIDGHQVIESALPKDARELYNGSPAERLEAYLDVPDELVEHAIPRWSMVAAVPPSATSVELLPHICHRLGIVEPAEGTTVSTEQGPVSAFVREPTKLEPEGDSAVGDIQEADTGKLVRPLTDIDAITHAWFGPGIPRKASKTTLSAYENALSRTPTDTANITVICTDPSMMPEQQGLEDFYDGTLGLPRTITLIPTADKEILIDVLTDEGVDLVHFIGHATSEGLHCSDGPLDVRTVSTVEPDLFLLNACETYGQATELVNRGAIGCVATNTKVANEDAVHAGRDVARLLSDGFSISASVEQVAEHLDAGSQYMIVGDGLSRLVVDGLTLPLTTTVRKRSDRRYVFSVRTYLRDERALGLHSNLVIDEPNRVERVLNPNESDKYVMSREKVIRQVVKWGGPYHYDGELYWPTDEDSVADVLD